jgi:hypothetical protein
MRTELNRAVEVRISHSRSQFFLRFTPEQAWVPCPYNNQVVCYRDRQVVGLVEYPLATHTSPVRIAAYEAHLTYSGFSIQGSLCGFAKFTLLVCHGELLGLGSVKAECADVV